MKKDLLSLRDLTITDFNKIIESTFEIKSIQKRNIGFRPLLGKALGMIFEKSSTRTRVSFEVAMYQLGGYPLFMNTNDLQLSRGETIQDTARVMTRYLDGIMIRARKHKDVSDLAKYSDIPVINGLTDKFHPCQVLADIFTLREHYKTDLKGSKVAFLGDGNNVCNSWLLGAAYSGMHLHVCTPKNYEPDKQVWKSAEKVAAKTGGSITQEYDPRTAVKGADVIYTDVWVSMGQENEKEIRSKVFKGYQINEALMKKAKKSAVVMHCLPAIRGEEITDEVMDGPQSIIFDQAENRLHVQKTILWLYLGDDENE